MSENYANIHTPVRMLSQEEIDCMSPREILEWSEACDAANPNYFPPTKEESDWLRSLSPSELTEWVKNTPGITIYGIREACHAATIGYVEAYESQKIELAQEYALADREMREVLFVQEFVEFTVVSRTLNSDNSTNRE